MAILQINTIVPAQVGVFPGIVRIVSDDDLATITTAGYLDYASQIQGYTVYPGDLIFMTYTEIGQLKTAILTASVSNGVITLTIYPSPATGAVNYEAPVTEGHFAVYNGTGGDIEDLGYLPSDATKTRVVMASAATTIGNVATFSDINGTIQNGGVLGTASAKAASNNALANLSSVNTPAIVGNVATFADVNGSIQNGGVLGTAASKAASDNALATVSSVVTPSTIGGFATYADANGSLTYSHFPTNTGDAYVAMVNTPANTVNDLVFFADANGSIKNMGVSLSNPADTKVVTANNSGSIVVGHVATFADVDGSIQDGGPIGTAATKTASNNVLINLASVATPTVVNTLASYTDTNGTIGSAYSTTNPADTKVVTANNSGSIVVGNLAEFSDVEGSVADSGFATANIQPLSNIVGEVVTFTGGFANFTVTTTATLALTSVLAVAINANANDIPLTRATIIGINTIELSFSSDPGAGSVSYIALIAPQT